MSALTYENVAILYLDLLRECETVNNTSVPVPTVDGVFGYLLNRLDRRLPPELLLLARGHIKDKDLNILIDTYIRIKPSKEINSEIRDMRHYLNRTYRKEEITIAQILENENSAVLVTWRYNYPSKEDEKYFASGNPSQTLFKSIDFVTLGDEDRGQYWDGGRVFNVEKRIIKKLFNSQELVQFDRYKRHDFMIPISGDDGTIYLETGDEEDVVIELPEKYTEVLHQREIDALEEYNFD